MRPATKAAIITGGVIIAVIAVLGIGVVVVESIGFVINPYAPSYYYRLEYENFYFDESDGTVDHGCIGTVGHGNRPAPLYVQFPNDLKLYFLPHLTEDVVRPMASSERKRGRGQKLETYFFIVVSDGAFCDASFYDGHSAQLSLSGPTGIRIFAAKDGEFVELPAKRSDIIRVFGKPLKIERKEAARTFH